MSRRDEKLDDEFYVGYAPTMPPRMAARLARVCAGVAVVVILGAAVVLLSHHRLETSRFDYGRPRRVSGVLERQPYPSLQMDGQRTWLVSPGKAGADALLADVPDGPATLQGSLIARGRQTMLEVVPGSVASAGGHTVAREPGQPDGREVTLRGEIVDSKCFLGVMNPGESTVHRDCARLCLRGGIPPMLLVRGRMGEEALIVLVTASGQPIGVQLAEIAGQPVQVQGRVARVGDTLVLFADRAQYGLIAAPTPSAIRD